MHMDDYHGRVSFGISCLNVFTGRTTSIHITRLVVCAWDTMTLRFGSAPSEGR